MAGDERPMLLIFNSRTCGPSRDLDAHLAHMLQKNGNHNTFRVRNIDIADRPDLFDRFNVEQTPTIVVVYHGKIAARMDTYKKNVEVAKLLSPWILTFDGRYGPKNSWKHYTSRS